MILEGDSLEILKTFEPHSIDSLVTDPPAGISFMGKDWDSDKGGRDEWIKWMASILRECHRVMKPGAHGLVWALPRTSHWTATACEDAGFNVRDVVTHLFGQGFPKSHNISKAIDKAAGAEREVVGVNPSSRPNSKRKNGQQPGNNKDGTPSGVQQITAPATATAKQWDGWGTALKPASEHWILIQKPISELTIAANVLKWGTGAINVDGCRVEAKDQAAFAKNWDRETITDITGGNYSNGDAGAAENKYSAPQGRFPANLVLSHSVHCTETQCDIECAVQMLDAQSGSLHLRGNKNPTKNGKGIFNSEGLDTDWNGVSEKGQSGASRFFYCAKISSRERNEGMGDKSNGHPTVKSKKLMAYLARLITPPGGIYCPSCDRRTYAKLREVPEIIPAGKTESNSEILFQELLIESDGPTATRQGCHNSQGLQNDLHSRTSKRWIEGNDDGASLSGGEPPGETSNEGRGCPSSERGQGRQSNREPGDSAKKDSRQATKAEGETNSMPALSQDDQGFGTCETCGENLVYKNSVILDPFMGSGSTGIACKEEGFNFVGIEMNPEYFEIAKKRIDAVNQNKE